MASDSPDGSANMDEQINYHEEMESIAYGAGDFTRAEHHRKMKEICKAMKERQRSYKTPEQLSDEDYKVAPTSADEEKLQK